MKNALELPGTLHFVSVKYRAATNTRQSYMAIKSLRFGDTVAFPIEFEIGDISKQANNWLTEHCFNVQCYGEDAPNGYIFGVKTFEGLKEGANMKLFKEAYIEALLWADCGPDNETYQKELAPETEKKITRDCAIFYSRHKEHFKHSKALTNQAAHDFWLTRQGHGSGFWDRPETWGEKGAEELTRKTKEQFKEFELYLGDDDLIHAM